MKDVIDARMAGGNILVDHTDLDVLGAVVNLHILGEKVPLFPHEARQLADALQHTADRAERTRTLRRSASTDETLRGHEL